MSSCKPIHQAPEVQLPHCADTLRAGNTSRIRQGWTFSPAPARSKARGKATWLHKPVSQVSWVCPQSDADVLRFREEPQRVGAAFAAHAGMLHAAEGRAQVAQHPAVDPDDAELQPLGRTLCAIQIRRPQRSRKTILRVVGDGERLVLVLERDQRDYRAE